MSIAQNNDKEIQRCRDSGAQGKCCNPTLHKAKCEPRMHKKTKMPINLRFREIHRLTQVTFESSTD